MTARGLSEDGERSICLGEAMQFECTSLPPRHLVCPECVTVPLCRCLLTAICCLRLLGRGAVSCQATCLAGQRSYLLF